MNIQCLSKRSNRVNASAVPPAKPAITFSPNNRLTLRAFPFITVSPIVTCPSPPTTTELFRRTDTMVVPLNWSIALVLSHLTISPNNVTCGGGIDHFKANSLLVAEEILFQLGPTYPVPYFELVRYQVALP